MDVRSDLEYLHQVANEVIDASKVEAGGTIPGGPQNTTGYAIRVPGGTQNFYPAFWTRDAAMMLGGDLVPVKELQGWIRVMASTQPGADGLSFEHGLKVPPYSIPDHVTLSGEACWYPGAYADQGVGTYGFLPPADDAFYLIQMVNEEARLAGKSSIFSSVVKTKWGDHPLSDVAEKAFDSVATDPLTGLVVCEDAPNRTRVDWGFCDSIRKTGLCLMPSLLRWQAARRLSELFRAHGEGEKAERFKSEAEKVRRAVIEKLYLQRPGGEGVLVSATKLGRKDDVWASSFAVWLGVLPPKIEKAVARHLLSLYRAGGTVVEGQVRSLPPTGELGGTWEQATSDPATYQNGGFWATPTGWLITAIHKIDRPSATRLLHEYVEYLRKNRDQGAPYEWINPAIKARSNANYGSSAGLVYISLTRVYKP